MRIVQMQNAANEKTTEGNSVTSSTIGQQQFIHPLLMPSLVCFSPSIVAFHVIRNNQKS